MMRSCDGWWEWVYVDCGLTCEVALPLGREDGWRMEQTTPKNLFSVNLL